MKVKVKWERSAWSATTHVASYSVFHLRAVKADSYWRWSVHRGVDSVSGTAKTLAAAKKAAVSEASSWFKSSGLGGIVSRASIFRRGR